MARISWNEIQDRAGEFASTWAGETYEKGNSQSFWSDFLAVFGVDRRRHGAFFEYAIKKGTGKQGFIDLFWPGKLLAEQKSGGKDLDLAALQAFDYLAAMPDHDLPRGIVVSDFATFHLIDPSTNQRHTFTLTDLPRQVRRFGFLIDEQSQHLAEEDPVNRQAAEGMARLHNQLRDNRYTGRDLELLLVRLVFCLFADDALIFERGSFKKYLRERTNPDGSDLGPLLIRLFDVLNTPIEQRQTSLDEDLQAFPYINGGLFEASIRIPDFTGQLRQDLRAAAMLDWSAVSPAIFGSMFQGVMDDQQRRNLGAHYTSERNILRVIKPLFLDDLYKEFALVRRQRAKLNAFHDKLASLQFLDPACGCGNFLVITYRELRLLEHKVVRELTRGQMSMFDVREQVRVNVDQMHGIEIEEFPALIAQTALWLTDHQMNREASREFGQHYVRLPLEASANIRHANALTTDWADVIAPDRLNYILGNPPFLGHHLQSLEQKRQMVSVLEGIPAAGVLDFVSAWYVKALQYIQGTEIQVTFVSTNSITQGEQAAILWDRLLELGARINFAHRTFKWTNDAKGVAAVYCVIIGFALWDKREKRIFDYPDIRADPMESAATNINPYLVDAPNVSVVNRSTPICHSPKMMYGSKPTDGGHFLLNNEEYEAFIVAEPRAASIIKPFISAREFLNGENRWVIWLVGVAPHLIRAMPLVRERVQAVKEFRANSKAESTRNYPHHAIFRQVTQPKSDYVLVPCHSSEKREYIPMGLFAHTNIVHNSCMSLPDATRYHFGVLTSRMHMAWVRTVCGRLKSDYRYSKDIVYNNFPWPEDASDAQRAGIERLAQAVLDARELFPGSTLADLYDPLTMPPALARAHTALDRAVDRLYRAEAFASDADRVALLFERYAALTAPEEIDAATLGVTRRASR